VIILFLILFAIYVYSQAANAEEQQYYEPKFRFPIPNAENIESMAERCGLDSISDVAMVIKCEFIIMFGEDGKVWYEVLVEESGFRAPDVTLCPERFYLDEDGITCLPILDTPTPIEEQVVPKELERFVRDLQRFQEDPPTKPSEIDYYEQLKFLQMCYRQTEANQQSLGVTDTDGFAVSNLWIDDFGAFLKSFELTGNQAVLEKAIEECKYIHTILNPVTLGAEYQNRAKYFNSTQAYHGDLAEDVPVWSQDRVNQESNDLNEPSMISPICEKDSYYSDLTKRMYCGDEYIPRTQSPLDEERREEMCNSMFVMPEFKQSNGCTVEQIAIPCYACEKHGTIYETEPQRLYADYVNNGDEAQLRMLKEQVLADTIKSLLR